MSTVIELDRNPRTVKETRPEREESRNNQDMDEVERPPGPGPGIRETENQSQTESQDDLVLPYSLGHHPTYVFNPALTARMPPNSFIGITPPPMPMMDYQSDQSSTFTQTFLRGILTSIDSKDPVVANAWLETLLDAIDLLPIEVIKQEIISIAINKSQLSQPPFSRMAACKMLGKLSTKLDQQSVRQEVLPSTLALCQDVESDVRNCMCRHLALVARGIGLELTKSAILPVLVELSNDESSDVRLSAIETVVHLLSLLDDEVCNNTIVPLVIKSCDQAKSLEDCTLPVIARHLGRLCHGLTPNLSQEQKSWFIVFYQQLSKLGTTSSTENINTSKPMPDLVPRTNEDKTEKYIDCRQACAYNLPGMVLFVGANNFTDQLFSTFCDFATDPSPLVRKTLAASMHELIKIIGTNFSLSKMQVVALFNDSNVEVLAAMVLNMVYVIDALARFGVLQFGSSGSYSQDLSLAILHMEEVINSTRNWRLHADCLEKLSCLANCISATVIQQRYIPLLFHRAHKSRPLPCRVAAVRTLLVILRFTVKLDDRTNIMYRIKHELARGRSCHSRMLFLKMCEMAIMLFSKAYFKQYFFSELLCLSQDSVANIRLKVVSLLPQLKSLLTLPSDRSHLQHLEETIKELLVVETDRDVLGSLQTSIQHLAEVETALDGMTKLGLYADDERDDDRKLREERLIANMEEQIKQVQGAKFEQLVTPSAIPSRLRSLGLDRKRSESLPPALNRAESSTNVKQGFNSPEPQRLITEEIPKSETPPPAYSQEIGQRNIWQSEVQSQEKEFKVKSSLSTPYSSSLENLDPSTQEFLVDAGIKLPTSTGNMTSAASMPNLTSIGKVKDPLVRSNSIPDNSNIDGDLSKYLISNEEMEHYEAEYHKAAKEIQHDSDFLITSKTNADNSSIQRGRPETRLRPPSFTSALINKPVPSAKIGSVSITKSSPISVSKPVHMSERQEVQISQQTVNNKSSTPLRNSPPKLDERTSSQKWNDGSIERLAEKWAAKRDTLLRETGVLAENLQQRKAAMEQKLESVKRSIPKRSIGFTPQSAQKRLSLCESFIKQNKTEPKKEESTKRKSLDIDIDIVLPPESEDSDGEDLNMSKKLHEIRKMTPPFVSPRKPSPELGSSDSDDSLPPYPATEKPRIDLDKPLPPPPPSLDYTYTGPEPTAESTKATVQSKLTPRTPMFPNSPAKSSLATYKTVTAPQTSVAVSRQLPAPQRSIADSPRLPYKKLPQKADLSPQIISFRKAPISDEKNFNELEITETNENLSTNTNEKLNSKINQSNHLSSSANSPPDLANPHRPASRLKHFTRKKLADNCTTLHSSEEVIASQTDTNSSELSKSTSRPQKRFSKIVTTHVSTITQPDKSFSTFKAIGKVQDADSQGANNSLSFNQKAGKTIVYIENSSTSRLKGLKPPTSLPTKGQLRAPSPQTTQESSSTQGATHTATVRRGKYGGKSLSVDSMLDPNPGETQKFKHIKSIVSTPYKDKKMVNMSAGSSARSSPMGSAENLLTPDSLDSSGHTGPANLASPTSAGKAGRTGIIGPRRSSGMRMWQGQMNNRRTSSKQASPTTSRSPSPSTKHAAANNVPGRVVEHATLPRTTNLSRLRAPASQGPQTSQQRRSYGGVSSFQGGKPGKHSSAPTTPRHSQGDLTRPSSIHSSPGSSRSSSPVTPRRQPSHYPPAQLKMQSYDNHNKDHSMSTERSHTLTRPVTSSVLQPKQTSQTSMIKKPNHSNPESQLLPNTPRPQNYIGRPMTTSITTFSKAGPRPSIPTIPVPKSRLPNPPKSFGYNQK
eukprot:TRINITY_DN23370_c0_g1_i1.p1 TRINITY_DN23370_c0_g1~~TRINITY_DN23370_c0_g1_i1.p1  ORF type:complete len:1795 (+),score=259.45 TRINITY_DN23370_c0_g1_i1:414-5798(+)